MFECPFNTDPIQPRLTKTDQDTQTSLYQFVQIFPYGQIIKGDIFPSWKLSYIFKWIVPWKTCLSNINFTLVAMQCNIVVPSLVQISNFLILHEAMRASVFRLLFLGEVTCWLLQILLSFSPLPLLLFFQLSLPVLQASRIVNDLFIHRVMEHLEHEKKYIFYF